MIKPDEETVVTLPEELHPDQEVDVSYGVCINPKCLMGHGTIVMGYVLQGELANGYCIDCWDAGESTIRYGGPSGFCSRCKDTTVFEDARTNEKDNGSQ